MRLLLSANIMAEPGASLLPRLASIVGEAHVLTAAADIEPYVSDWRGRYRGTARAVVLPSATDEVAAVVRACADTGTPIVPQGGNTGLCGGAAPDEDGREIVVSLRRMNRVRAIDAANATITVEAGMPLAALQAAAAAAGFHFPLSLASEGSCTIGGNLSTNAGGTAVLRYGNTRELTLGLEVVLADGRVLPALRGLRKDNTGYDLKQLFIGAEGTLGIVTAAVMKLFPAAGAQATALVAVPSVERAIALLSRLKHALSDRLVGFELMSAFSLALSRKHHPGSAELLPGHPWYALVQADDSAADSSLAAAVESALAEAVDAGDAVDASIAQSKAQAEKFWALRENISEAQRREGPNIKHDISLPVSAIPAFMAESDAALIQAFPGSRLVVFGHLGDGNLHYNLSAPEGVDARDFMDNAERANRIVHDLVARHGGSFSAEHGVGQLKRADLVRYKSAVEVEIMRAIKAALDPASIMNPGKVL
jgi:FAD/FMN-containing dehydrogenase